MNNDLLYLVWLASVTATGSVLPNTLLKYFSSAKRVYEASREELEEAPVEWKNRLGPLLDKDLSYAEKVLEYCEKNGVGITCPGDHFYPQRLRELQNAPIVLYHLGKFCDIDLTPCVTVVGTREPSPYGQRAAKRLCVDLARGGATLVSGLARGIDALAHRAALFCESFTIGVLGCGIDRVYPPEHRDLIEQVSQTGLLLTEFAPGTPPNAKNFPLRNRLLAALGDLTLVVEAGAQSGALITAEHCIRLKRTIYTVPGSIFAASAAGSNHLLRCGAKSALNAEELLSELSAKYPGKLSVPEKPRSLRRSPAPRAALFAFPGSRRGSGEESLPPEFSGKAPEKAPPEKARFEKCPLTELSDDERMLLTYLSFEPKSADALTETGIPVSKLLQLLSSLEIKGYAERKSGARFSLTEDAQ